MQPLELWNDGKTTGPPASTSVCRVPESVAQSPLSLVFDAMRVTDPCGLGAMPEALIADNPTNPSATVHLIIFEILTLLPFSAFFAVSARVKEGMGSR